jgi:UrcA family protein
MNGKLHRLITAAPAAVALTVGAMMLAGSGTALAASAPDAVIQYGDLNTATPVGVQKLADRVRKAAWDYCLQNMSLSEEPSLIDNLQCREAVIGEALAKINNPMLNQEFPGVSTEEGWPAG